MLCEILEILDRRLRTRLTLAVKVFVEDLVSFRNAGGKKKDFKDSSGIEKVLSQIGSLNLRVSIFSQLKQNLF